MLQSISVSIKYKNGEHFFFEYKEDEVEARKLQSEMLNWSASHLNLCERNKRVETFEIRILDLTYNMYNESR